MRSDPSQPDASRVRGFEAASRSFDSIRCAGGWHKWKPHHRMLRTPRHEEVMLPWVRSLFDGPPVLFPSGIFCVVRSEKVCERCTRCGARRPVP